MRFRFLETGAGTAAFNMGLDEAVLESVAAGAAPPTLRFYRWEPRAVSVGYFQGLEEEVDLEACARAGVDVIRRATGGGAVYHAAELTYSIVVPEDHPLVPRDVLESYWILCRGVIEGLGRLGVKADFAPLNDVITGGRKVSGNAQTRKLGCVLQHGTVLLEVDVDEMFGLLKVPQEKLRGKLIEDVKQRVTSVSRELGRTIGYAESLDAFKEGFAVALAAELEPAAPTERELARAAEIAAEKYANPAWNRKR
ncbi:MAG: lipoate--protein ligase family protein [Spirochaetia bacterium]|nr:lipoate--protein ligase family protein [Spirochaetia bacterium]